MKVTTLQMIPEDTSISIFIGGDGKMYGRLKQYLDDNSKFFIRTYRTKEEYQPLDTIEIKDKE